MKEKNGQALTLNSLMDCNLYDVSLVHEQSRNVSVLVDKLNRNILTEQGQKDWSDVMQARITRITGSRLGLDVCVDGCSAQRLSDFTHAINGECSLQNYDRWVRDKNRIYTSDDNRIKLAEYPIRTVNFHMKTVLRVTPKIVVGISSWRMWNQINYTKPITKRLMSLS